MHNSNLIPNVFIRRQLSVFLADDNKARALLAQHDIPESVLTSDGYTESEKLATLANTIWRLLDDESTGAAIKKLRVGSFKMLCHACSDCKTLRSVIHRTINFFKLISDEYQFNLEVKGEECLFTLQHHKAEKNNDDYFMLCLSIVLIRWFAWLIDRVIKLERVEFKFDNFAALDDFERIFQSKVEFNQSNNRIVFASHFLNHSVMVPQEKLPAMLISAPYCFLSHYQQQNSIAEQVRKILTSSDEFAQIKLSGVADKLHVSSATLTRKLKAENTSFMDIKDRTRKSKALTLLRTSDESVTAISYQLGFSEASAFNRAFKKWTGENPAEYRNSYQNPSIS